jgi:hypothetical protein
VARPSTGSALPRTGTHPRLETPATSSRFSIQTPFTTAPIEARSRNRGQPHIRRKLTINILSEALFASLMLHRRRREDEVRRHDLFEEPNAAREHRRKRS